MLMSQVPKLYWNLDLCSCYYCRKHYPKMNLFRLYYHLCLYTRDSQSLFQSSFFWGLDYLYCLDFDLIDWLRLALEFDQSQELRLFELIFVQYLKHFRSPFRSICIQKLYLGTFGHHLLFLEGGDAFFFFTRLTIDS